MSSFSLRPYSSADAARLAKFNAAVSAIFAKYGDELASRAVSARYSGGSESREVSAIVAEIDAAERDAVASF